MSSLPINDEPGLVLRRMGTVAAFGVWLLLSGCAAFHPIRGVPARYLPEEYRGITRAGKRTIDPSLLVQTRPPAYLVDTGDILGIYIEGVLGDRKLVPPVNIPLNQESQPSFGYPIPIRDDGTISLPTIGTINVRGLSIRGVEERLTQALKKDKQYLSESNDRIFVSLQKPRMYRVLVIRQEAAQMQQTTPGMLNIGTLKRGTGQVVSLPAYKNDVLNALAQSGGLPGLDAENAIYVIRRRKSAAGWTPVPSTSLPAGTPAVPAVPPAEVRRSSRERTVVRAQAGEWGPPPGGYSEPPINPQGDYRRFVPPPVDSRPLHDVAWQTSPGPVAAAPQAEMPQPPEYRPQPEPAAPAQNWQPQTFPPGQMPLIPPAPGADFPQDQPWPATQWPEGFSPESLPTMTPEEFGWELTDGGLDARRIVKIPVRLGPGESVDLKEQDVILEDGDIVFIESRDTEVFYTGGLLGGGQFTLPRDYNLNVLEAIAVSQGQRAGGGGGSSRGTMSLGGPSALNQDVTISASSVIILRYLADGRLVPIEVNLYQAKTDVAEQVIIQPGDYIILQYTKAEAYAAFIERHLLEGALFGLAAAQLNQNRN